MSDRMSDLEQTYAQFIATADVALENAKFEIVSFPIPDHNKEVDDNGNLIKEEWLYKGRSCSSMDEALRARNADITTERGILLAKKAQCSDSLDCLTSHEQRINDSINNLQKDIQTLNRLKNKKSELKNELTAAMSGLYEANSDIDSCFDCVPAKTYIAIVEAQTQIKKEDFSDGTIEGAIASLNGYIGIGNSMKEGISQKKEQLAIAIVKLNLAINKYSAMII